MLKGIFKKADLILLAVLLAGGLVSSLAFARSGHEGARVTVKVAGELYGQYSLYENQEIDVKTDAEKNYNMIRIKDGQVSMTDADCRNQDCVRHKPISRSGEAIICLPHKVVVTIDSSEGSHDSGKGGDYDTLAQ